MPELFLTIFFISILLIFLGTGVWVALSMVGVSAIGMFLFTSRPVEMQWLQQFGERVHLGL